MLMKQVIKMFENGNCSVCGLRGKGKDMLMANVVVRRHKPYVSNVYYGGECYPLDLSALDCGKNTYEDFIDDSVHYYEYPYGDGVDVYVSDAGVYFPSQYCNELNRKYPYLATFQALSRHVGNCNFHFNAQTLNRVYDKIREQSDTYIRCMWCKVIFGKFVIQRIYIYERYQSAVDCVPLFDLPRPILNPTRRLTYDLAKQSYQISHGKIQGRTLFYINKSTYDTRRFKEMLENGKKKNP